MLRKHLLHKIVTCTGTLKAAPTIQNWGELAEITLCQVITFHNQRGGEVSKIRQLRMYIFIICILCRLDMVEIEGKRGRELPLLLMPDIKEAMEILVKKRRSQHQSKQQVFLYPPV